MVQDNVIDDAAIISASKIKDLHVVFCLGEKMITKQELRDRLAAKKAGIEARVPVVEGKLSATEEMFEALAALEDKFAGQQDRLQRKLVQVEQFEEEVDFLPTVEVLKDTTHLAHVLKFCEPK